MYDVRGSRVRDVVIDIGGSQKAMLTASMLVAHQEFVPSRQREGCLCARTTKRMRFVQMNIPARICKERGGQSRWAR